MSQTFSQLVSGVTLFSQLYSIINDNFAAIKSQWSGTSAPGSPSTGQPFYNTTNESITIWNGTSWLDISKTSTEVIALTAEIIAARGSAASLDARLSVSINQDGTLKSSAPVGDWWMTEPDMVAFVDATSFTVIGDKTAIYVVDRAIFLNQTTNAYGYIVSSVYSSDSGLTTVVVSGAVVDSGLSAVEYGQPVNNAPERLKSSDIGVTVQEYNENTVTSPVRIMLVEDVTIYVDAATGDDANDGLTPATPMATIQVAYSLLSKNYDLAGYSATIKLADGTYAGFTASRKIVGDGTGAVIIDGNLSSPTSVTITTPIIVQHSVEILVTNFSMESTHGLISNDGGLIIIGQGIVFKACVVSHMLAENGGMITIKSAYTVIGGAANHMHAYNGSIYVLPSVIPVFSGVPAFSIATASVIRTGYLQLIGVSFSGTATGTRYTVKSNGVIDTNGGGVNVIPGSVTGTTATGGQYV